MYVAWPKRIEFKSASWDFSHQKETQQVSRPLNVKLRIFLRFGPHLNFTWPHNHPFKVSDEEFRIFSALGYVDDNATNVDCSIGTEIFSKKSLSNAKKCNELKWNINVVVLRSTKCSQAISRIV